MEILACEKCYIFWKKKKIHVESGHQKKGCRGCLVPPATRLGGGRRCQRQVIGISCILPILQLIYKNIDKYLLGQIE